MEKLPCRMEEVQLPLELQKHEDGVGVTPEKTIEEEEEETSRVLKEKNSEGHQNMVARRNKEEGKKITPSNVKVPEKTMEEEEEETPSVLKEKNSEGHQNIVARRNKEEGKKITPPNVKVPPKRAFGFSERYRSPTDSIMSPATRGLLARNKKSMRPIELPTYVPPKAVDSTLPSAGQPPM